jgi:hypothetical protein
MVTGRATLAGGGSPRAPISSGAFGGEALANGQWGALAGHAPMAGAPPLVVDLGRSS